MRSLFAGLLCAPILLTGCSLNLISPSVGGTGSPIQGRIYGGRQPIVGARIYVLAAGTSGYGGASSSLLTTGDGSDSIGTYVASDSGGSFSITGDYKCTAGAHVYLLALGGDPGSGANSAAGLMAVLGNCPVSATSFPSSTFVFMNEVSTIAAAYSMAAFAVDPTHVSSSGSTQAEVGIANAFANAAQLVDLSSGTAPATVGNATVPQTRINTLGNILAACVNSTGPTSSACTTLFSNTLSAGATGTTPTNTAIAAINMAHNPGANIASLCGLQTGTPPFVPDLSCTSPFPSDFAITIQFTGGGLSNGGQLSVAIDASGNVWMPNYQTGVLAEFSPLGAALSGTGFTGGGLTGGADAVAIDNSGNVWIADVNSGMSKFSSSGTAVSPSSGYIGGGQSGPSALAIDPSGNVWMANDTSFQPSVSKFSSAGAPLSGPSGFTGAPGIYDSTALAIDISGNVWIANSFFESVTKMPSSGSAAGSVSYSGGGISAGTTNLGIAIDASGNVWTTGNNLVAKLDSSGNAISPSTGYTGGGLAVPKGIAIDGLGNAWVVNFNNSSLSEFTNAGVAVSASPGFKGTGVSNPQALAIDSSGDIWVASVNSSVVEFIGIAAPVVTPIAAAVKNHVLGTRP